MPREKTHYETLGVARNASAAELKAAYKDLARSHHPDITGQPDSLTDITAAWQELKDLDRRQAYDAATFSLDAKIDDAHALRLAAGAAFRHELKAVGQSIWFNITGLFGQTAKPDPAHLHVYMRDDAPNADL